MNYFFDTFTNFLSGLGVPGRDKLTGSAYVAPVWTREQLETSFRSDWIARKAISIPAHDATREWRAWQAKQPQIEKLEETEKRLQVQLKLQQALTKARLYGGCCLLIGVEGNTEKELDPDTIKKDGLKFIDKSRIDVVDGTREFEVNGVKHTAAGDADIYNKEGNGRIRLYGDHLHGLEHVAAVTAHEVEHFKFQGALNDYRKDYDVMMKDPGPAPDPGHQYWWGRKGGSDAMMSPDGSLKPPYDKKYPAYTAMHEALHKHPIHKFAEGDGVSKYSAEYWNAAHVGKAKTEIAFHETLAKIEDFEKAKEGEVV